MLLGGGDPHRFTLSDGVLIKDNHLALVPIEEAVRRARAFSAYKTVEVEVETADEAVRAARAGADMVLLDNMTPAGVRETLAALAFGRAPRPCPDRGLRGDHGGDDRGVRGARDRPGKRRGPDPLGPVARSHPRGRRAATRGLKRGPLPSLSWRMSSPSVSSTPVGEVRVCPDCGYRRGFHVTFPDDDGGSRPAVLCCPECGARFDIGWRVRL